MTNTGELVPVGVVVSSAPTIDDLAGEVPTAPVPVVGGFELDGLPWLVSVDGTLTPTAATEVELPALELDEAEAIVAATTAPGGGLALTTTGRVLALGSADPVPGRVTAPSGQVIVDLVSAVDGVYVVDSGGGIQALGTPDALTGFTLPDGASRIVAAVQPSTGAGLWMIDDLGAVRVLGSAPPATSLADLLEQPLQAPIVDALANPGGTGLWLFGADGGVFALDGAPFLGSGIGANGLIAGVIAPES